MAPASEEVLLSTSDLSACDLPARLVASPESLNAIKAALCGHTLPRILFTPRPVACGRCGPQREPAQPKLLPVQQHAPLHEALSLFHFPPVAIRRAGMTSGPRTWCSQSC